MKCPECGNEKPNWFTNVLQGECRECRNPIETFAYDQDDMDEIVADRDKWMAEVEKLKVIAKYVWGDCRCCKNKDSSKSSQREGYYCCSSHSNWAFDYDKITEQQERKNNGW